MEKGVLLEIDGLYVNHKVGLLTDNIMEQLKKSNKNCVKKYVFDNHYSIDFDKFLSVKDINFDENGNFEIKLSELNDLYDESGFTKINYYKTKEVFYNIEKNKTLIESQLNKSKTFKSFKNFVLDDYKYFDQEKIYHNKLLIGSHSLQNNVKKRYLIKNLSNMKDFDPNKIYQFKENTFLYKYSLFGHYDDKNKELILDNNDFILKDFYYIHDMELIDLFIKIIKDFEPKKTLENVYYSLPTKSHFGVGSYKFIPTDLYEIEELFCKLIRSKILIFEDEKISLNQKMIKKIKSYFEPYKLELIEDFDFSESILVEKTISVKDEYIGFYLLYDKYIYKKVKK